MLLAQYELCTVGEAVADQEAFNGHLNIEQANKVQPEMPFLPKPL